MKHLLFIFSLLILFSFGHRTERKEQVIFDRIEYTYNLKSSIDETVWKGFASNEFDLPLIHYTGTACYVANSVNENGLSLEQLLKTY